MDIETNIAFVLILADPEGVTSGMNIAKYVRTQKVVGQSLTDGRLLARGDSEEQTRAGGRRVVRSSRRV